MFQPNPRGYTVFTALQTLIELSYTQVRGCRHKDQEENHSPHCCPHHHHQYHQHHCHASQPFADSDRRAAFDRGSNSQHRRMYGDSKSGKVHTISGNKGRFTLFFEICNHDIVISPSYEIHKNIKYLRYLATKVDLC